VNGRSLLTGYRFREVAEFYARDKGRPIFARDRSTLPGRNPKAESPDEDRSQTISPELKSIKSS